MRFLHYLRVNEAPMLISLGVVVLSAIVTLEKLPQLHEIQQRIESVAFDARIRMTLPDHPEPDPQVVIVDVDERSLAAEGRWPWPRARVADLVNGIAAQGASVIAFDMVFAEPQQNPAQEVLDHAGADLDPAVRAGIEAMAPALDQDEALAAAFTATPVVAGYAFNNDADVRIGALAPPTAVYDGDPDSTPILRMSGYVANLQLLQQSAQAGGFFSVMPDYDGVIRRVPTVLRHGDAIYASLAVEAVRLALGGERVLVHTEAVGAEQRVSSISIDDMIHIPTDGAGRVIVPFRGRSPAFRYVSALDILQGTVEAGAMEGSIVLVGTTATGAYDLRSTPVQPVYPGVEVHASIVSALFGGGFPVVPSWARGADIGLIVLLGCAALLLFPALRPSWMLALAVALVGGEIAFNTWLWSAHQLVLSLATPVMATAVIAFVNVSFGFLAEARSRNQLKESFGQYVPASLVERMNRDPDKDFGFDGESRELSVLFSDIRGFTAISEVLTPQELKQYLNAYLTPMTEIIFRHHGTIDKYVGDMIMAFWGAPLRDADHRRHAIDAALGMLERLARLREEFAARGWPVLDIGIGINSGVMNVGDMGSKFRKAYTVLGDAVNLGSRLESLTKQYGVRLILSEFAVVGVEGVLLRTLDRVRVQGKHEPVTIFEGCCRAADASPALLAEIADHHRALEHYFAGDWGAASAGFGALAAACPQKRLYALYLERIEELRLRVGHGGWDGVHEFTSK